MHTNQNDYKTQIIKWLLECGTTEKAGKKPSKADEISSIEHSETHVLIFTKADTYDPALPLPFLLADACMCWLKDT